jgi:mannosylfructose-6-phosphate phosphatase
MERVKVLISDVDGTLLGDHAALAEFCQWRRGPGRRVRLVYNSGRFVASVQASIREHSLPEPDAIIGGVGTQIFETASGEACAEWPPRDGRWDSATICRVCRGFPELAPQPAEFLSEFKISYFAFVLDAERLERLSAHLARAGQSARIVYSSQRDLDILPAGVDKGAAALRLCRQWSVDVSEAAVAGDSGNDLAMFRGEFRGIVVGNAQPELRALVGPHVYQARASYAAGVLEGLHHWMAPSVAALEPVA